MTIQEHARAKAESIARPHGLATFDTLIYECEMGGGVCTCGRDSEVAAIAAALEEFYGRGHTVGIVETYRDNSFIAPTTES